MSTPRSPGARRAAARIPLALAAALVLASASRAQTTTELITWLGAGAGDQFGSAVEVVGDVDGDGVRDLAVGAPDADIVVFLPFPIPIPDAGEVTVFSGDTLAALWTARGGATGDDFGRAIADAGDVDGDGFDDVLVGAPGADGFVPDAGKVQLLSGADGSVLRTFNGFQTAQRFGEALCAGPMDTDASWEVAIGAPAHDLDDNLGGTLQEGFVYVFRIVDGQLLRFIPGTPYDFTGTNDDWVRRRWGAQLAYVGDTDGNGFAEIVVSAPFSDYNTFDTGGPIPMPVTLVNTGFVRGFEPLDDDPPTIFDFAVKGFDQGAFLGLQLESLGPDLFGPDASEFAIGAPGLGRVEIHESPDAIAIAGSAVLVLAGFLDPCFDDFSVLGAPGDVDGDGFADVAVAVPGFTASDTGRVCIFSRFDGELIDTLEDATPGTRFGSAVAGTDVNGDGRAEVAVGIRLDDTAGADAGAVTLFADLGCTVAASWSNYGAGLAGTFGVPSLTGSGAPELGTEFPIGVGNSAGTAALAFAFLGLDTASVSVKGGTLLVDPFQIKSFTLPLAGATIPFPIPDDLSLCGLELYLQVAHADGGAPLGVAFTPGLMLVLGS